jgi:hypothetical protein
MPVCGHGFGRVLAIAPAPVLRSGLTFFKGDPKMRILVLVFVLLLGMPVMTAQTALAQSGVDAQQAQATVDDVRTEVRGALNTARQFLGGLFSDAKEASGLNDEQLFGAGVGLLTGLLIADIVGFGSGGSVVFAAGGVLFGKWVTTPK